MKNVSGLKKGFCVVAFSCLFAAPSRCVDKVDVFGLTVGVVTSIWALYELTPKKNIFKLKKIITGIPCFVIGVVSSAYFAKNIKKSIYQEKNTKLKPKNVAEKCDVSKKLKTKKMKRIREFFKFKKKCKLIFIKHQG
ncbi:hypothetical protein KAH94_04270 [bacterium]|nr:hypothetical protein [bacterium]